MDVRVPLEAGCRKRPRAPDGLIRPRLTAPEGPQGERRTSLCAEARRSRIELIGTAQFIFRPTKPFYPARFSRRSKEMSAFLRACLLGLALGPAVGLAAPRPATPAQDEIAALLDHLSQSRCQFQRNGRWHGAGEARAHLERKLRHLRKRIAQPSAEQFIAHAATGSSLSGKPYQVRCPAAPLTASADWFGAELRRLRAAD
jgi:hypothetical protein